MSSGNNQENVTAVAVLGLDSSLSSSASTASTAAASLNKSKAGKSRSRAELDYEPDFALAENNEVLTSLRPEKEEKDDTSDEYFEDKTDVAISLNSEPDDTTTAKQPTVEPICIMSPISNF